MAALIPLRKSLLIAVSAVAALLGAGSAHAASGSAHLANDPSGAKVQRSSPVKSTLGGQDTSTAYGYYYVQGR
ncbi:hypothetical protein OHA37_03555 [Streptomyces sp. NBC_00335]|uniref:hypothetical protein n=1 Tax=unclassified Streptomyces TaxID=2593676 RepID=UPI002256DCF6|nr:MULTISPECIES: hypothetical protein [unclassified Streptomyces]MCX5402961.1 hypothetical protein [Streptomyces sp. NBC_00086]